MEKKYSVKEVQEKVNDYLKDNAFTVSERFSKVSNLRESIENAVRKGCSKYNRNYQVTFSQVIDTLESAILSSKNWFNEDGLNFKSFRNCLNIRIMKSEKLVEEFELKYNIEGNANEKLYDIKDIICIGQAKRFKTYTPKFINNWVFNPCLRFQKIEIEDNSDAYQEEKIEYKSSAKGAIIKGFKGGYLEETLLIGIHYHSYSENKIGNKLEYCPTLEKFELILVI